MSSVRKKMAGERPEMPPKSPFVGDRIKLKPDRADAVVRDCKLAGWTIGRSDIRIVTRIDDWCPGGGRRLFVEGEPFCFASRDVELAWNSPEERRVALMGLGSWRPIDKAAA